MEHKENTRIASRQLRYERMPEKVVDGRDKPGHDEENDAF
jgi:hypothetical protein